MAVLREKRVSTTDIIDTFPRPAAIAYKLLVTSQARIVTCRNLSQKIQFLMNG